MSVRVDALVIGAGPAGLMAAEELAAAGRRVVVAEAMPTPARKFLMAGKSGLNLTKAEPVDAFVARVESAGALPRTPGYFSTEEIRSIVSGFGPDQVIAWAQGLGVEVFTGSTGRVFPVGMKASPLVRAWLARLAAAGVGLRSRWRWQGFDEGAGQGRDRFAGEGFLFDTPEGQRVVYPDVTVLALGGASWPRLGSDAAWVPWLAAKGVEIAPFRPANMGFRVDWSLKMERFFGAAVKGAAIHAGKQIGRGEWVISCLGIEGGGVYELAASIRDGAPAHVDLAPDLDMASLTARFSAFRGRLSLGNWLRRVLGDPVKVALLLEWGQPLPGSPQAWAARAKALPLRHSGPLSLERAISSAGGIALSALGPGLELRALPRVFAAGEMLDWEAPTGGYLLTTCLALGRHAGRAAAVSV